jgi:hypothetical protein
MGRLLVSYGHHHRQCAALKLAASLTPTDSINIVRPKFHITFWRAIDNSGSGAKDDGHVRLASKPCLPGHRFPTWQKPYGASLSGVIDQVFDVLMFPADPLAGLRSIRRSLKPDGLFCAMVFRPRRPIPALPPRWRPPLRMRACRRAILSRLAACSAWARRAGWTHWPGRRDFAKSPPHVSPRPSAWLEFVRSCASPHPADTVGSGRRRARGRLGRHAAQASDLPNFGRMGRARRIAAHRWPAVSDPCTL